MIPARFRAKARTWRERHHPDSIEKRHIRSAADRRLEYSPDRDGMAWLSAYLPADQAAGIWDRATTAARAMQGPTETRTLTQLRADRAAAWLLGGEAEPIPSPKAQVLITVPVFALMGLTDEPATLDGYGPIPASMARALVADGAESFHRVLTDPRDGAPLEIGRSSYRIPKACANGSGCGTANARSLAAATSLWTTKRTTSSPGPTAEPQGSAISASHAAATTSSNTPRPGHPQRPAKDEPPGWTSPTGRHYQSEHRLGTTHLASATGRSGIRRGHVGR